MRRIVTAIVVGILVIGFRFPVHASVSDQLNHQSSFQPLVCMEQLPKSLVEFMLLTSMGDVAIFTSLVDELEALSQIVGAVEKIVSPYAVVHSEIQLEQDHPNQVANAASNDTNTVVADKHFQGVDSERDCSTLIWSAMLIYATWRLHGRRHDAQKGLHDADACNKKTEE